MPDMSPTPELTQKTLTERGFHGFVPFRELPNSNVPTGHGIYVVIRTDTSPPSFLPTRGGQVPRVRQDFGLEIPHRSR